MIKYILILFAICTSFNSTAQFESNEKKGIDTLFVYLLDYLPPLNAMIDTALNHSPEVQYWTAQIKYREYDVSIVKNEWMRDIYFTAQYQGGTLGAVVSPDASPLILGYLVGGGVRVPISTFASRKDKIGAAESWLESVQAKKMEAMRNTQELVFQEYQKLLLLQRQLTILTEAKESSSLIMEMAEERFRQGELTLDQLGQNTELKAKYNMSFEEVRTEFFNTYGRLERLVGVPFSKFEKF